MKNYSVIALSITTLALSACSSTSSNAPTQSATKLMHSVIPAHFVQNKAKFDAAGKLTLAQPDFQGSSSGDAGYDAGMNAVKNKVSGVSPKFSAVKGYDSPDGKTSVYLRDPAATGFEYQAFGQAIDNNTGKSAGYVVVGKPVAIADHATINATYTGIAMGTYNKESEVIADMKGTLAWGANGKTLTIDTTNSKIAAQNASANQYTDIKDATQFNFNDKLTWSAQNQRFESKTAQAHTYGKDAAEIGGTFSREVKGKAFVGGFGAKKD